MSFFTAKKTQLSVQKIWQKRRAILWVMTHSFVEIRKLDFPLKTCVYAQIFVSFSNIVFLHGYYFGCIDYFGCINLNQTITSQKLSFLSWVLFLWGQRTFQQEADRYCFVLRLPDAFSTEHTILVGWVAHHYLYFFIDLLW